MESLKRAVSLIKEIIEDTYVPKNIRDTCKKAFDRLENQKEKVHIRIGAAICMLDELSQDPNLPYNTRTQIWEVASLLETASGEAK
jgi:uncharacterized protein (UPF0147 family)